MPEIVHEFHMEMTCGGCESAAKKVMGKLAGVSSVEASAETKKVTVTADSSLTSDQLLEQLNKTGKVCSYLGVKQ